MRFFRSSKAHRLFILGLDGSPLPLLKRLMAAGDLPNLARVFETGSAIEMNSSLPDVSAVAWTSINTGSNPGKHGIYGFVDRKPGTKTLEVMTASHVKARTLWELVSDAGKRAIAINVPLSYPPQRINGVVVSDFLAPALNKAVYPTRWLSYLENIGYRIDTDPWVARESLSDFLVDFKLTADKRAEAVLHLMKEEEWDLFMVVFMETDRLHHFMWQYMEEEDPVLGPKFIDAYRHLDVLAGKILDRLTSEDQLLILSDHGFTTLKHEIYLNVWLEEEGYLKFEPGMEKCLESIRPDSRAYSLDPGRIYLNSSGSSPGSSLTAEESKGLVDELAEKLESLRDPQTGEQILRMISRGSEIYSGPQGHRAPDLLVMGVDGYDIKGSFDSSSFVGRGKLVGMHKYDNATLFVRNSRVAVDHASVHDVLPTACSLLNIPCPPNIDGRSVLRN